MPQDISAKISPRDIRANHGRISKGASTMPTNTCTAAPKDSAPPTPSVPRNSQANPRIIACNTPQCTSKADNAEIVSTSGNTLKARIKLAPG